MSQLFEKPTLNVEDYWRGIVLYGRNVASYKFALAKSLLELKPNEGDLVTLEELAPHFSQNIAKHLLNADRQSTSTRSKFLDACRDFNQGTINQSQLVDSTVQLGFNNVIDAFHVVGGGSIPTEFYIDERKQNKGIRITSDFSKLLASSQQQNLNVEVESRWNLVERAWELKVSKSLISVSYDIEDKLLYTFDNVHKRKTVTSCRGALNGYQNGHCFYCFDEIRLNANEEQLPDVDHVLPHTLLKRSSNFQHYNLNGVWNLVLSCQSCNRGEGGKFEKLVMPHLLRRLHVRNEYLIGSNHPLKETLVQQTGKTREQRVDFLKSIYKEAAPLLIQEWAPIEVMENPFKRLLL